MLHRHFLVGEQRIDRVARVLSLHQLRSIAVIHTAFIAQMPLLIEDEDVWGRLGSVRARYLLRIAVIQVWIREVLILHPDLHLRQSIAYIG